MSRGMVDTGTIQHLAMAAFLSKPNLAGYRQRQDRQHPQAVVPNLPAQHGRQQQ